MQPDEGRNRVIIAGVSPEIEGGRFPIKRIVGDEVQVEADILTDGHDAISAVLLYRKEDNAQWSEAPFAPLGNEDRKSTRLNSSHT
jgi:starch synthase (maltosyl-transferring)